ncbi:AEC family transporter [Hoeflea sp. CAU 1731]
MIAIFESSLPIFLLIVLGIVLKRTPLVDRGVWHGLEEIGYFVLFPCLLFLTLYRADFSGMELTRVAIGALSCVTVMFALAYALWPLLKASGVSAAEYTAIFQTATRWNSFVALAISGKLFGEEGLAVTALVMALIILPINCVNVAMLVWFNASNRSFLTFLRRLMTNPLIIAALAGVTLQYVGLRIYEPFEKSMEMVASSALGIGLILVGAALRIRDTVRPRPITLIAVAAKLLIYPLVMFATCLVAGLRGNELIILTLIGSVPTAMNGYLLAKQMGSDAQLYATVATLQTVASFLTIPLVLYFTTYMASG